jgi:hypothetical protein
MTLSKDSNPAWGGLDPNVLEPIIREVEGFIAFDDLETASQTLAPGLKEAFWTWGRGITVTDAGIPLRDWKAFLQALRTERQCVASKADGES